MTTTKTPALPIAALCLLALGAPGAYAATPQRPADQHRASTSLAGRAFLWEETVRNDDVSRGSGGKETYSTASFLSPRETVVFQDAHFAAIRVDLSRPLVRCTAHNLGFPTGCFRYTYDRARDVLTLADADGPDHTGSLGTRSGTGFELDGQRYTQPTRLPRPGQRFDVDLAVSERVKDDPPNTDKTLALRSDGTFTRHTHTDDNGDDAVDTTSRGTYRVGNRGRIVFTDRQGHTTTQTIQEPTDADGVAVPGRRGLIVDGYHLLPTRSAPPTQSA